MINIIVNRFDNRLVINLTIKIKKKGYLLKYSQQLLIYNCTKITPIFYQMDLNSIKQ